MITVKHIWILSMMVMILAFISKIVGLINYKQFSSEIVVLTIVCIALTLFDRTNNGEVL